MDHTKDAEPYLLGAIAAKHAEALEAFMTTTSTEAWYYLFNDGTGYAPQLTEHLPQHPPKLRLIKGGKVD